MSVYARVYLLSTAALCVAPLGSSGAHCPSCVSPAWEATQVDSVKNKLLFKYYKALKTFIVNKLYNNFIFKSAM
jgi:hypothetical protein